MKTVLLTGAAGFIGAHCVKHWLNTTDWNLVLLDSFRHKGMFSRLDLMLSDSEMTQHADRITVYRHDLSCPIDFVLLDQLKLKQIDYIVNMASDSAVGRSVHDPRACWENNTNLIVNMLELLRKLYAERPCLFFQISTDEVYGEYNEEDVNEDVSYGHLEWADYNPSNPYSASKAAQEMLCMSYFRTYQLPIVITNTMNNFGEAQDPEKFIPTVIKRILEKKPIQIFTDKDGDIGSRVYLHCEDHADALKFLINRDEWCWRAYGPTSIQYFDRIDGFEMITSPDIDYNGKPLKFNICGDIELNNKEVVEMIFEIMGESTDIEMCTPANSRPGYDKRYLLCPNRLKQAGWQPKLNFTERLARTVHWYWKTQSFLQDSNV